MFRQNVPQCGKRPSKGRRGRRPLRWHRTGTESVGAIHESPAASAGVSQGGRRRSPLQHDNLPAEFVGHCREAKTSRTWVDSVRAQMPPQSRLAPRQLPRRGRQEAASQSSRECVKKFKSVFPATCAAEKLPEARLMPRPRADQPSKARAMEREYPKKEALPTGRTSFFVLVTRAR